jgi:hypothetical protein
LRQLSDKVVASGGGHLASELSKLMIHLVLGNAAKSTQDDDLYDDQYGNTFGVDTDFTDILAHTTYMQFEGTQLVIAMKKRFSFG